MAARRTMLLALLLFAQSVAPQSAYTTMDPDGIGLATRDGRYALALGDHCSAITPLLNVTYFPAGSGGSAVITTGELDADGLAYCSIVLTQHTSDAPCATNAGGDCDVGEEPS